MNPRTRVSLAAACSSTPVGSKSNAFGSRLIAWKVSRPTGGQRNNKGFSHWVTRCHFFGLTSKIPTLGSMLNFDADVKETTACENLHIQIFATNVLRAHKCSATLQNPSPKLKRAAEAGRLTNTASFTNVALNGQMVKTPFSRNLPLVLLICSSRSQFIDQNPHGNTLHHTTHCSRTHTVTFFTILQQKAGPTPYQRSMTSARPPARPPARCPPRRPPLRDQSADYGRSRGRHAGPGRAGPPGQTAVRPSAAPRFITPCPS